VSGSVWMKFGRRMINHVEKNSKYYCKKLSSLQRLLRTTSANVQTWNSKYHKRWYYFAAQWHFGDVLQCNIIFCDICCVRSASWRMLSLKGVVNCFLFFTIIDRYRWQNLLKQTFIRLWQPFKRLDY